MNMETPLSTGKVKVEYSDPYGVFQLVASDLQSRLPLENLNWASASRPTRSIDSLYVELVPDEKSAAATGRDSISTNTAPDTPTSPIGPEEARRKDSLVPVRERRHQIPGLRRTPYLKVYILRCDDTDTYKATARRAVREWIKANSASSQGSGSSSKEQENHDAFEYMIIHVVLPDVQTGSTWPTKASVAVLDKLKSDFNTSSKTGPDRIAQIPATKSLQVQGVTVNPIPSGPAKDAFLQESNKTWDDLIAKMKALILNSFDSRVKQYEEDIKEKQLQRSLPGWNFCTFSMLKEGLARGFESVGLVDDALMGYDELSVELLFALREDKNRESKLFREHTQELLIQAEAALQGIQPPTNRPNYKRLSYSVLDIDNKPYRELILANNISAFDFRSYLFARQTQIMLRLASLSGKALKANSSSVDLTTSRDPVVLADICWRAKEYFADIARIIRQDLKASFRAESNASEAELAARFTVAENMIASWTYKGAMDILNKTREPGLPDAATPVTGDVETITGTSTVDSPIQSASPSDTGEVRTQGEALSPSQGRGLSPTPVISKERLSLDSVRAQSTARGSYPPGVSSLAAERAELYLIARRAFGAVGNRQGWKTTWPTEDDTIGDVELDEVSLDDSTTPTDSTEDQSSKLQFTQSSMAGVLDPSMRAALEDKETFYKHWEELSLLAFLLFEVAKVRKSVYFITADIAAVRVRLGDYDYAAPFLRELGPMYAADQWHDLEVAVLDMYVFCLKKLEKPEEYVPAALQMLSKTAKILGTNGRVTNSKQFATPFSKVGLFDILQASGKLAKPHQVALDDFFNLVTLDQTIIHCEDSDEYGVTLRLHSRAADTFPVDSVVVKLVGSMDGVSKEILLSCSTVTECQTGQNNIRVVSKNMIPDWYTLDSITLTSGKVTFFQSYKVVMSLTDRRQSVDTTAQKLLIWPSARACTVEAAVHNVIQLETLRAIAFLISSNQNNITKAKLMVKSGTAGLRLHTADAEIIEGESEITKDKQPSTIPFGNISSDSLIKVKIPYTVEGDIQEVNVRSELSYEVDGQVYIYGSTHRLSTQLPLGVNVQDVFKTNVLFSKFAISTSTEVPIRVLKTLLADNDSYEVSTPYMDNEALMVFAKQPASLVYRIAKKAKKSSAQSKKLSLQIDYECLDEQVITSLTDRLVKDCTQTDFKAYITLLRSHFKKMLRQTIQQQDLEMVGLLQEITIPAYSEISWEAVLFALPEALQVEFSAWLQEWHEQNKRIPLGTGAVIRHIGIPVEIPPLPVLHTASITFEKRPHSSPYTVGEIITGELQISHTRHWSSSETSADEAFSFTYELEASAETWLLAGQRRGYFSAVEGEIKTFPILLLALRAGKLMLPVVEIRPAKEDEANERTACETNYQSLGTAIEVVPGVTGVSLDVVTNPSGGLDGEVKVLEIEREGRVIA